jgi:bacterioferritin-associated ferredoxin
MSDLKGPAPAACCHAAEASPCSGCSARLICHCLGVTEGMLRQALMTFDLRTVKDMRRHTGAGDGCTACHRRLKRFIDEHAQSMTPSPAPICS